MDPIKFERELDGAYVLDIPNKGKLHDFFHVSSSKKKLGPTIDI